MTDGTPCECLCGRPARVQSWYCGPCYSAGCETGACNAQSPGPEETIPARPNVSEEPPEPCVEFYMSDVVADEPVDFSNASRGGVGSLNEKHERLEQDYEDEMHRRDEERGKR